MNDQEIAAEAENLREAIKTTRPFSGWAMNSEDAAKLGQAARGLLNALGERY